MHDNLLEIHDLTVQYVTVDGTVRAVNDLSFSLKKGETLGLVGETGAGKTTTVKAIMRILPVPPSVIRSGRILFEGQDLLTANDSEMRRIRGRKISMIFQDPMTSLNPVMTVGEQIAEVISLHYKLSKSKVKEKTDEILNLVGIEAARANDYPHQFSGGMKQRVIIAIALACEPQLLIADEPTTALDVTIQAQILALMRRLRDELKTSMIMITHDLGIVADICDQVAIMYAGEIVEYGSKEHIFRHASHPYTKGLFGCIPNILAEQLDLIPIQGMPPDAADLPSGCYFSPRCPLAVERCFSEHPVNHEISPGHFGKCHLLQKEGGQP
ncbi:MAG: ABC transporter ATP-binding protein [Christensenellales bacterium]|jgi:peptide/nickel transport system ATP-binding protein